MEDLIDNVNRNGQMYSEAIDTLRTQIDDILDHLGTEMDEVHEHSQTADEAVQEANHNLDDLGGAIQTHIEELDEAIEETRHALSEYREDVVARKAEVAGELDASKAQTDELAKKMVDAEDAVEQAINDLRDRIDSMNETLENAGHDFDGAVQESHTRLAAMKKTTEDGKGSVAEAVSSFCEGLKSITDELSELIQDSISSLHEEEEHYRGLLEKTSSETVQGTADRTSDEIDHHAEELRSRLSSSLDDLVREINEGHETIVGAKDRSEKKRSGLERLIEEFDGLVHDVMDLI